MGNTACALYILNMEVITQWLISCYDMLLLCLIGKQEHLIKGESVHEQVSSKGIVLTSHASIYIDSLCGPCMSGI